MTKKTNFIYKKGFCYNDLPRYQERYYFFWRSWLGSGNGNYERQTSLLYRLSRSCLLFTEMCVKFSSKDKETGLLSIKHAHLFDLQRDFLREAQYCFLNQHSLTVDKSRQLGVSWLSAAFIVWVVIFHEGQMVLMSSKTEDDLYQKSDISSFMGKVEFIIDNLPPIFKRAAIHEYSVTKRKIRLNSSDVLGVVGPEGARGKTATLSVNDEFSFHSDCNAMLQGLASACKCNLFVSTPNRPGDEYERMKKEPAYRHLVLDWKDDPRIKDKDAYREDYISKYGLATFNREMERMFSESGDMLVFSHRWLNTIKNMQPDVKLFQHYPITAGLDLAARGADANVLRIRQGGLEVAVYRWTQSEAWETVDLLLEYHNEHHFSVLAYDTVGIGYGITSEFSRRGALPFEVLGVNFSGAGNDMEQRQIDKYLFEPNKALYSNLRAQLYWMYRERIRKTAEGTANQDELLYVHDNDLIKEMEAMTYDIRNKGRIQITSKRELRRQGIRSPDNLDADIYCLYAQMAGGMWDLFDAVMASS